MKYFINKSNFFSTKKQGLSQKSSIINSDKIVFIDK